MTLIEKDIVNAIVGNPSRLRKISACKNGLERRNKVKGLVVAECAAQKVKLTEEQVFAVTAAIVYAA